MPRPPSHAAAQPQARGLAQRLRARLAGGVTLLTTGGGGPSIDYAAPPGDPGLFGPEAVCWRVHADFTSMMTGGIAALLLQALHPLALAGVWDHSTFRTDILGRLRRTATFVAGTTFGSRADALALIERVKTIHAAVTGTAPDGRPYRASDPALLTWVHVAEVSSFLAAYLRYVNPALSGPEQDRYYAETALIATLLGARDVPASRAAVAAYLARMRGELAASERTREVIRVLRDAPVPRASMKPAAALLFHAGIDLLPDWAQRQLDLASLAPVRRVVARPGIRLIAPVFRWALVNGASKRARRRAAAAPDAVMTPTASTPAAPQRPPPANSGDAPGARDPARAQHSAADAAGEPPGPR
ncbi:oxygenase MpaB family protein [Burkholderia glumae]|uniref:Oxygenase MpaB family protein n=2 Tax=Burkholderia glumae TaxID=337 RepID=A0ABY5BJD0_BURGL|nr:oxygenase MpaB family protein [Burkholderia glumae]KHJ61333.1 histidine kinase [Burkholderia glumae]MCM2481250.1 oxygenase MpaB family protein [Burkholderia glumae]MCM2492070.1 oxygenase MpaB family protein [Burkholderia glumae]MCM2508611.1 oxygenase MpaB family protein [Burkholderia glumae]MCM2537079.1 oxygenase MpaB family protein [Burkholderia glumae]